MKVAFFDDRFAEVYGAQENVLLLATAAQDRGHDVIFVTTMEGVLAEAARERNLQTVVVEAPSSLRVFEKAIQNGGIGTLASAAVNAVKYSHTLHKELRRHNVDVVVPSAVRPALLLLRTRLGSKTKTILFAQNSTPFGPFAAAALPGIDLVAFIADGAKTTFPSWAMKIFRPKVDLLPSGRDLSEYDGQQAPVPPLDLHLVTACSITERKGIDLLLRAMAKAQREGTTSHLTVVGGTMGPQSERYQESLTSLVEEHSLSVDFVGWNDDIRPFLRNASVFVLGSHNEGLPGVLIEAMAMGLPCITTNAGGSGDAVLDGICGVVVPVGDDDSFASAIVQLDNPEVRATMGKAAMDRAFSHYSLDSFAERFEELAQGLLP